MYWGQKTGRMEEGSLLIEGKEKGCKKKVVLL